MAVAKWQWPDGSWLGPRNFPPPKRADVKHWYRSAHKTLPKIPTWPTISLAGVTTTIDERTIIFESSLGTLYISRKEYM